MSAYSDISAWIRDSEAHLWGDPQKTFCFYSGTFPLFDQKLYNWQWAKSWSEKNDAQTIETTQGWKELDARLEVAQSNGDKLTRQELLTLQGQASIRYAEAAVGHVKVFCLSADPARIFVSKELPALLDNGNVETINGFSREDLSRVRENYLKTWKPENSEEKAEAEGWALHAVRLHLTGLTEKAQQDLRDREQLKIEAAEAEIRQNPIKPPSDAKHDQDKTLEDQERERREREEREREERLRKALEDLMEQSRKRTQAQQNSQSHSHSQSH